MLQSTMKQCSPFTTEFDALVSNLLDEWHVPGMSIAIVDGERTFAKARLRNNWALYIY